MRHCLRISPWSLAPLALLAACGSGSDDPTGTLSGSVLNSPTPVGGAKIVLRGSGGTHTAFTNADGTYDLAGIPTGQYNVEVCGQDVFDENGSPIPDKINLTIGGVIVGTGTNPITGKTLFLPERGIGFNLDTAGTNTATIPAGTIIQDGVSGVTLVFSDETVATFPTTEETSISVTRIPTEELPLPLPQNATTPAAFAIEPIGTTFDVAPRLIFANESDIAEGAADIDLFQLRTGTQGWERFGSATVSLGGLSVVSDDQSGLSTLGVVAVGVPPFCTTDVSGVVVSAGSVPVEGATVTTVGGATATTDDQGRFTMEDVAMPTSDFMVKASVTPPSDSMLEPDETGEIMVICGGTTDLGETLLGASSAVMGAPAVVSVSPVPNTLDVDDNVVVSVTFSERMTPSSFQGAVELTADGTAIEGTWTIDNSGNQAVLNFIPTALLPTASELTFEVAGGVRDTSGDELGESFAFSFTTAGATSRRHAHGGDRSRHAHRTWAPRDRGAQRDGDLCCGRRTCGCHGHLVKLRRKRGCDW